MGFGTHIVGQELEVHTLELIWVLIYRGIYFHVAPAGGIAGAPQAGFLGGQVQDLHGVCYLGGLCQVEQHEVVAVVFFWIGGVVLQEAQVELRVWEAFTDLDELCCVFILKQVVATQPELVITGEREGPRGMRREEGKGRRGRAARGRVPKERKRNKDKTEHERFRIMEK